MDQYVKFELAKEIINYRVARAITEDNLTIEDEQLQTLVRLQNEVNRGNQETIDYVIEHLSPEDKKQNDTLEDAEAKQPSAQ